MGKTCVVESIEHEVLGLSPSGKEIKLFLDMFEVKLVAQFITFYTNKLGQKVVRNFFFTRG